MPGDMIENLGYLFRFFTFIDFLITEMSQLGHKNYRCSERPYCSFSTSDNIFRNSGIFPFLNIVSF